MPDHALWWAIRPCVMFAAAMCALGAAHTASADAVATAPTDLAREAASLFGLETDRLWPVRAPQATADDPDQTPTLTVFRPQPGLANGTAVIVAPGGGYMVLAGVLEGRQIADWFTTRGVTAFVLRYRVGAKARLPVPLLDGKRAIRFVRANAARFQINPGRIGMIGFSAGGHLVATVAGQADDGVATSDDKVEQASSRLNFVVLAYPWLRATTIDAHGKSQYCQMSRTACNPADFAAYDPLASIDHAFPPTFLYHTSEDALVHPDGSIALYQALLAQHVPVEMHIFAHGQHGTGFGGSDPALARWPELLDQWLRAQGLFSKATAIR